MTIGSLAQQAGVRRSAIRYDERLGLLPAPHRRSGRRDYDPDAVAELAVVQFAVSTGFTLREAKQLVRGFSPGTAAGPRWRALSAAKRRDLDARIARAVAMKALRQRITTNCRCDTLIECGRALARSRAGWTAAKPRRARAGWRPASIARQAPEAPRRRLSVMLRYRLRVRYASIASVASRSLDSTALRPRIRRVSRNPNASSSRDSDSRSFTRASNGSSGSSAAGS